jgi:hypothetical protein
MPRTSSDSHADNAEVVRLRQENETLRRRVAFLEGLPVLAQGIRGESLIAQLVNGKMTVHIAPHDVDTPSGTKLEVKFSRLTTPVPGCNTKRWNWCYPLGTRLTKTYDRLILVGEADERYAQHYMDPKSPYVMFDIPMDGVRALLKKENMIAITTNPSISRRSRRNALFDNYQVTADMLKKRYGIE